MSKNVWLIAGVIVLVVIAGFILRENAQNLNTSALPESLDSSAGIISASSSDESLLKNNLEKKMYTQAVFKTNKGDIVITLDQENTPKTVENFTKLAESGFYNGTKFHRIIKGFMIQGGDPLSQDDSKQDSWGTGGPGYKFDDEIKSTNSNAVGTISMANAGPNTNGSQFFINVADNSFLNGKHTVFGRVTTGYDIVEKISLVATGPNDRPIDPVVITAIELK